MRDTRSLALVAVAVVVGLVAARIALPRHVGAVAAAPAHHGLTFASDVVPGDRQVILDAIARARPAARRLIARVGGMVTIRVAHVGGQAVGLTTGRGDRYDVTLDLGTVYRMSGQRGIDRLVLHELGHVVDFALVPPALDARLDAEIPRGYACAPGGDTSACAPPAERFAETFAKWATGDLGVNVLLGYGVLAPASLEDWGRPLAALAGP